MTIVRDMTVGEIKDMFAVYDDFEPAKTSIATEFEIGGDVTIVTAWPKSGPIKYVTFAIREMGFSHPIE